MNVLKKIKKICVLAIVNTVCAGTHFYGIKRKLLNSCDGIAIGSNTKIVTPIHIPWWSILHIGDDCWIGRDFTLEGNGEVYIGDRCDLAPNVTCATGSHAIGGENRRAGEGFNGIIRIGNGSWVGTRALLLPNTAVGNSCVVGAASVVTKDLESNCVYAGSPARRMRNLCGD